MAKTSLSVLKRERQSEKRRTDNRRRRKTLKDKVKQLRASGNHEEAAKLLPEVQGLIDREARRNTIHRNTARRLKSRLARTVAELK
ncbi:MAG: 30S ribosomal protein S20 [bacterium]